MPNGVVMRGSDVVQQFGLNDGLSVPVLLLILLGMYFGLLLMAFMALKRAVNKKKK